MHEFSQTLAFKDITKSTNENAYYALKVNEKYISLHIYLKLSW